MPKAGYYMPQRLMLTASKPSGVVKEPAYANKPLYGDLKFGPSDGHVCVALDEAPDASAAKLYIDANVDGDLTNDPSLDWKRNARKSKNPQTGEEVESVLFQGSATIKPKGGSAESVPLNLAFYRFAPQTAKSRGLPTDMLLYYRDYGREGKMSIGGKSYDVMLLDEMAAGRYDVTAHGDREPPRVTLLIDRNGDGQFGKGEQFDLAKPFNIGGETYAVDQISPDGASIKLKVSATKVAETPLPASLGAGKPATSFSRPVIGGKTANFPQDYKGRLVMLDFWATWCGPCREELPNLVKAYQKYHQKGFDILGISLDQKDQLAKVQLFLKDNHMPWPQVYDGKYWGAEIAQLYGVDSIPRAYLVDGTTGKIIATGETLRGETLDGVIAKALASSPGGTK